jgi:hypothetical protein
MSYKILDQSLDAVASQDDQTMFQHIILFICVSKCYNMNKRNLAHIQFYFFGE